MAEGDTIQSSSHNSVAVGEHSTAAGSTDLHSEDPVNSGSRPDVAIVLCAKVEPKFGLPQTEVEAARQRKPEAGLPPGLEGQGCTDPPCAHPTLDQRVLVCLQSCFALLTTLQLEKANYKMQRLPYLL